MSTEESKAHARRFFEEIFNQGNFAVIDELCAPNYVYHDTGTQVEGPEKFKQFVSMYRTAFPDMHVTIEDLIAEGDKVVVHQTFRATHGGHLRGMPPTGKQVRVSGVLITRIINGRAEETWGHYDTHGLLQQLGVSALPKQAG
jgi:steroid delta-isomerase-like uncharacterized protein